MVRSSYRLKSEKEKERERKTLESFSESSCRDGKHRKTLWQVATYCSSASFISLILRQLFYYIFCSENRLQTKNNVKQVILNVHRPHFTMKIGDFSRSLSNTKDARNCQE
jgi:hypothetical protein